MESSGLRNLPFRISIAILTDYGLLHESCYDVYFTINVDSLGKSFFYEKDASNDDYKEKRKYVSSGDLIQLLFGYFGLDKSRHPFLLYRKILISGERLIDGCTFMNLADGSRFPLTPFPENKTFLIPRKVQNLNLRHLCFASANLPFDQYEFLENVDVQDSKLVDFSKTISKFKSNRLSFFGVENVSCDSRKEKSGDVDVIDDSFVPIFIGLKRLYLQNCDALDSILLSKLFSYHHWTNSKRPEMLEHLFVNFSKTNIDELFKNYSLKVPHLNLRGSKLGDLCAFYLGQNAHNLRKLYLSGKETKLSATGFRSILNCENLEELGLSYHCIDFRQNKKKEKEIKKKKKSKLKNLNLLWLETVPLWLWTFLADRCPSLQNLNLTGTGGVGDDDLAAIIDLMGHGLEYLCLARTEVTDERLVEVLERRRGENCALRRLNVHNCEGVTREGVERLKKVKYLKSLVYGFEWGLFHQKKWERPDSDAE